MLDFTPVRNKEMTMAELTAGLEKRDLGRLMNDMVDTIQELVADATDADVVFVPDDPEADDPYAEDKVDVTLPWTLGHVIVHVTASNEESAALAAELARGVEFHGRSRAEIPWQSVTTIAQCRHRLEESRRMCLSSLEMWPDQPHLENTYQRTPESPKVGPVMRFVFGLSHADSHLNQLKEILRQSKAAAS